MVSNKDRWLKRIAQIQGNRYDYSKVEYINDTTPVTVRCRVHGYFDVTPEQHLSLTGGCPKCKESKGETRIREFLEYHDIKFIQEYRIEPFHFRYDFWLPKLKVLIEFHGQQHFKPVGLFGGAEGLKETVLRDQAKREVAKWRKLPLVTLTYKQMHNDTLERVLRAKLNSLGQTFTKRMVRRV